MATTQGHSGDLLSIRTAREEDAEVIAPCGELDIDSAAELDRAMQRAEASSAQRIIVDLSGLQFIDSTGIRLLLQAEARSRADGSRLFFMRPAGGVARVLRLCGIEAEFRFLD
jgi:anti-anti-sigma factor